MVDKSPMKVVTCRYCDQKVCFPIDRGELYLTCPRCRQEWYHRPIVTDDIASEVKAPDVSIPERAIVLTLFAIGVVATVGAVTYAFITSEVGRVTGQWLWFLGKWTVIAVAATAAVLLMLGALSWSINKADKASTVSGMNEKQKSITGMVIASLFMAYILAHQHWRTTENYKETMWRDRPETLAYRAVEKHATDMLLSPSTATFPNYTEGRFHHVRKTGERHYDIHSWVDAQNVYGATIRRDFHAEVEQSQKYEWEWNVISFEWR